VAVKVPYNLRLSEEVKIYQKMLKNSNFRAHIAPHTLEVASMFAILSRLAPTSKADPLTKVRLYDGEEVVQKGKTSKISVSELQEETRDEGMFGISTRFIMKALDNALAESPDGINPINVREALISEVKTADFSDDTRKAYLEILQDTLHKHYLELLEKEITKAFVYSFEEQAESLFQNYLDHAEAYVNKTQVKDGDTGEGLEPDEEFLKLPPGSDGLSVGVLAPGREGHPSVLRAAQGGDREEAHGLGAGSHPHRDQVTHQGRGAAEQVRRSGQKPLGARLQRVLGGSGSEVRRQ
jgi:serine protein kinase